jgi:hypothetical protein
MAEFGFEYFIAVALWAASLVLLLAQAWRGWAAVVGLSLSYWCNLAMIHLLGGLIQLLPWHVSQERSDTIAGFCLTGYALAGLIIGSVLIAPWLFGQLQQRRRPRESLPIRRLGT